MNKNLRPAAAAEPAATAAAYEPVQKHKVTPSILGWLNNNNDNKIIIIIIIIYLIFWYSDIEAEFEYNSDRQWASSTGLTGVSKFKPRLPAQWAVGTHRKGPSRMEKVTSRMNWPISNSAQIRNQIQLIDNTIMWKPLPFFISNRFYRTLKKFGPWNDRISTEISWVVTMVPTVPSADILRWPVTSQWPSSKRL